MIQSFEPLEAIGSLATCSALLGKSENTPFARVAMKWRIEDLSGFNAFRRFERNEVIEPFERVQELIWTTQKKFKN